LALRLRLECHIFYVNYVKILIDPITRNCCKWCNIDEVEDWAVNDNEICEGGVA